MSKLLDYLQKSKARHLDEVKALLSIPSISTDPAYNADVQRAAQWIADDLRSSGLDVRIDETPGHPIVRADWLQAGPDAPTVLVYGHYDVQPPDPLELWETPPFEPTVRDGKLFARGSADDKGQVFAHLKAAEAHMKVNGKLPVNLKILIEGEEESGSENLEAYLKQHAEDLTCDFVLISDTHMFAEGIPSITYGLRGLTYFELTIEGPDHDLHSGLYGGAVANPINTLCEVIASLKDQQGRITVEGFYDDVIPLTQTERDQWATLPFKDETLLNETGSNTTKGEDGYTTLERTWARPTLDCNGIWGGYQGEGAKTVLPSKASVKFSCRLVPAQNPRDIEAKLKAHLANIIPDSVRYTFTPMHGGKPVLVSTESKAIQAASKALSTAFQGDAVQVRGGGSIPVVADFKEILGVDSVLMGFGLPDDRLHSPNEKYNLTNLYGGIQAATLFLDYIAEDS